ncbi:MAG: ABC transporter ATP-binding protein, partial [Planctomycetota bacterium]
MIRLEAVSKTYGSGPSAVAALRAVELEIRRGEFVAISGPSGSGKSTLLYILGLLDRPQEGRYLLEGRDVTALPDREVSALRGRRIGFVFQSFHLLPRASALENVMLPLLYAGEPDAAARARAALARV